MESHKAYQLAERFWQGDCTEQEERELKAYVAAGDASSPDLELLSTYFKSLDIERSSLSLDASFDEAILAEVAERRRAKTRPMFIMRMAAGIALIVGLSITALTYLPQQNNPQEIVITDTYEDPEVAFNEVKKALMKVSSNLNTGLEPTIKFGEFHKAKEAISR